jgi:hypothetical protein
MITPFAKQLKLFSKEQSQRKVFRKHSNLLCSIPLHGKYHTLINVFDIPIWLQNCVVHPLYQMSTAIYYLNELV